MDRPRTAPEWAAGEMIGPRAGPSQAVIRRRARSESELASGSVAFPLASLEHRSPIYTTWNGRNRPGSQNKLKGGRRPDRSVHVVVERRRPLRADHLRLQPRCQSLGGPSGAGCSARRGRDLSRFSRPAATARSGPSGVQSSRRGGVRTPPLTNVLRTEPLSNDLPAVRRGRAPVAPTLSLRERRGNGSPRASARRGAIGPPLGRRPAPGTMLY
jgi:hypothetical protein